MRIFRTIEEQLNVLQEIQKEGNVVLVKFDGERPSQQITVIIDFPQLPDRELIRFNGDNLQELLHQLIKAYYSKNGL